MAVEIQYVAQCFRHVRAGDRDRYLTVLQARPAHRLRLAGLYAFNLEIARTRETVSEPALGEIRLQWWRETIEGLYGGTTRQHEVAQLLADILAEVDLPRQAFMDLIDAREADLYDEQPETLADLEAYAESTGGALQALAAMALGGSSGALDAARQVGIAWALTGLMRAIPHHLQQGRIMIPRRMMMEAGWTDPARPEGEQMAAMRQVLGTIASRADLHLAQARSRTREVARDVRPALRLAPLTDGYLAGLRHADFDPSAINEERGALGRQMRLFWAAMRNGY